MANIDNGFRVDLLSLDDKTLIVADSIDPTNSGYEAPEGSLYVYKNGTDSRLYIKNGTLDTDWTDVTSTFIPDGSITLSKLSTEVINQLGGNYVTTNITLTDSALLPDSYYLIRVDSSTQSINITLPELSTVINTRIHIKWVTGPNPVQILTTNSETIDDLLTYDFINVKDSVMLYATTSNWDIL